MNITIEDIKTNESKEEIREKLLRFANDEKYNNYVFSLDEINAEIYKCRDCGC